MHTDAKCREGHTQVRKWVGAPSAGRPSHATNPPSRNMLSRRAKASGSILAEPTKRDMCCSGDRKVTGGDENASCKVTTSAHASRGYSMHAMGNHPRTSNKVEWEGKPDFHDLIWAA